MNDDLKSQKARGVNWLAHTYDNVPGVVFWPALATEAQQCPPRYGFPCFARPCPTVPRHGFVDSRRVASMEEARAVYQEAQSADPMAEMILMPMIDAHASAVVTPTWAAIGDGHDGATAGKAGTLAVQMLHTAIAQGHGLIPDGQVPYLEVVFGSYAKTNGYVSTNRDWYVQLRSGPAIGADGARDYIPRDVTVARVIDAHAFDALALEAELNAADAAGEGAGLVIWQAGGNPCSHAACHARLHGFAIVFGDEPRIGDVLAATACDDVPMDEVSMADAVRSHGVDGAHLLDEMDSSILWAIHQAPALARSEHGARFVGSACVTLWRYAATAAIGEARHSRYVGTDPGKRRRRRSSRPRHAIYATALRRAATDAYLRSRTVGALAAFEMDGNFGSGYGGEAWANCTRAALALYDALAALSAGKGTANAVVLAAHAVVNSAHNNGPFLNKFIGSGSFDEAAHGSQSLAVRGLLRLRRYWANHPAFQGKPWPVRKTKACALVDASRVQWSLRMDGTALHAQYVTSKTTYKSATIPVASLSRIQQLVIREVAANVPATLESRAQSGIKYWPALNLLADDCLRALFPNA